MIEKPRPKVEVAVCGIYPAASQIVFYATPDAATEFANFGTVHALVDTQDKYWLYVDARYDFDEVVAYIQAYNEG